MTGLFKIYSGGKIKTFTNEVEMAKFAKEKNLIEDIRIKLTADEDTDVVRINVKGEEGYELEGYLARNLVGSWCWVEDIEMVGICAGEGGFAKANGALKSFIEWKKGKAWEGESREKFGVFDVYSPAELGLGYIKD